MNTMHPLLEDARLNIARHELAHAWLAHELGFFVEGITLEERPDRHTGCAEIVYPLDCATFGEAYERSPLRAAAWAVQLVAIARAGCYAEVHAGMSGAEPRGRDLSRIEEWRTALLPIYGPDGWTRLYAESFRGLKTWYAFPSVREVFREASVSIAQQQSISRYQLLSIFQVTGAGTCPPPRFAPILAQNQHSCHQPQSHLAWLCLASVPNRVPNFMKP